jgi:uncharacterized protein (DUF433 family)/DNA-binding transcriptional MerR regulator
MGILDRVKQPQAPRAIGHYSAAEVGRLAGVSARRIGSWSRYGIIPHVTSRPKVYSYADAGEAVLVRYLLDQEIPTKQIREIVENLRKEYGQWPLAVAPLEHAGPFVVVREGDRIFFSALDAGQSVIAGTLINLQAVRDALSHGGWAAYKNPREHIEVDPDLHSGQPVVRGRRLPTELVAEIAREEDGRRILREDYGLSEAEIRDALAYEDDVAALVA